MPDPSAPPCILVVADRERVGELVEALSEVPRAQILISSGGDDTIDLFESRRPVVVVVTATLAVGDARSLIVTLRGMVRRSEVAIVVVGDDAGPIRTALDALDLAPDRFVTRPLSAKALRFAVTGGIESVRLTGSSPRLPPPPLPVAMGTVPGMPAVEDPDAADARQLLRTTLVGRPGDRTASGPIAVTHAAEPMPDAPAVAVLDAPTAPSAPSRAALRARWAALADAMANDDGEPDEPAATPDAGHVRASDAPAAAAEGVRAADEPATAEVVGAADQPATAEVVRAADHPATAEVVGAADQPATAEVVHAAAEPANAEARAAAEPATAEARAAADEPTTARVRADLDDLATTKVRADADDSATTKIRAKADAPATSDVRAGADEPATVDTTRADDERAVVIADARAAADAASYGTTADDDAVDVDVDDDEEDSEVRVIDVPHVPEAPEVIDARDPWDEPEDNGAAAPAPTPVVINPRRRNFEPADLAPSSGWRPGSTDEIPRMREPTLILREPEPPPAVSRTWTGDGRVVVAARTSSEELWSEPMAIPELVDREPRPEPDARAAIPVRDDLGLPLADIADELGGSLDGGGEPRAVRAGRDDAPDARQSGPITVPETRDFARELRAKMSMMAQRLFQGSDAPAPSAADHAPRHDHHTEIDLAGLGDEPPLGSGAEIEPRAVQRDERRDVEASPASWDSQVRERGLPDTGAIVRGVSDAAMLLARMFAQGATGRVGFRRDDVETVVYFDHGRPVFASSNEPRDRMGELLAREGKITAAQYERCQTVVAESGRRMGEILVDLGYLKRRELLPAVRRHVEDLVYSLFGWERGTYYVVLDPEPSAERIRLSRHPAALILEGIRRKLDRTSLERLVGPSSTVIEVRDRERLGGIVNTGDLAAEERGALAAFDGQADLAHVARTAGVDIADVLPLAWGLCVLGLATARRTDADVADETTALVGETDLAIDRERVRARWQLVTDADYFALLGVRRDATGFEIRRAYQAAHRDFAADCFPSDLRRELARELDDIAHVLDEAFRVLRDDQLRQTYLANLVDQ